MSSDSDSSSEPETPKTKPKSKSKTKVKKDSEMKGKKETKTKRITFTKAQRDVVWRNQFRNLGFGPCPGCNRMLYSENFEVSHIKSLDDGGTNEIDNLIPACRMCNRSCSTTNFRFFTETMKSKKVRNTQYLYRVTSTGILVEPSTVKCIIL